MSKIANIKIAFPAGWFGVWLFTIAIAHLGFWSGVWAVFLWPYYLGTVAAKVMGV